MNDDLPPPPPPASARPSRLPWLAGLIPLAIGGYLGYLSAYQSTLGGFGGGMNAAFIAFGVGALVVVAALVGVANLLRPGGRGRAAGRYAFAAAGLIAAGGVGGYAAVPIFDLGYHEPVVLQARGDASVTLEVIDTFEPRASGRADCQSVEDGTDVQGVTALSLGLLNGGLLRAGISLPAPGTAIAGSISIWIDGATLPEGSAQPFWESPDPVIDASPDGTTGRARFEGAAIHEEGLMGSAAGSWPASLSGEISWVCEPWLAPDLTPPPAIAGQITLDLSGVKWSATPGGVEATCEFEADGSVWTVSGSEVGSLQGKPMAVQLDLGGDPRQGDQVTLMLSVQVVPPTAGRSLPLAALVAATSGRTLSWADLVTIEEIADGGRSGVLSFQELPNEGTLDPAWPAALDGRLSWECR